MQGITEHAKWHDVWAARLFQEVIRWGLETPPFVHHQIRRFRKLVVPMTWKTWNQQLFHWLIYSYCDNSLLTCFVSFHGLISSWDLDNFLLFTWFLVIHHARLLNQPRANYPSYFVVDDQLPALLTDTHKWMKRKIKTDIWTDLKSNDARFALIPFVEHTNVSFFCIIRLRSELFLDVTSFTCGSLKVVRSRNLMLN